MSTSACRRRFSPGCVLTPMALRCRDARLNDASTRDAILSEVHALLAEDTRFAKMYQQQWGNDRAWNSFYPIIVSRHDIAGVWVAFFSRCQRYRC